MGAIKLVSYLICSNRLNPFNPWLKKLVSQGVNDGVHAQTVGVARELRGIIGIIHPFPCVAEIGIVGNQDHQAAGIVEDSANMGIPVIGLFPGSSTSSGIGVLAAVAVIGRLKDSIDIVERVKYLVG